MIDKILVKCVDESHGGTVAEVFKTVAEIASGGGGGSTNWESIVGKPETFPPSTHHHDADYEPKNENIQQHIASPHAPANAQKNSDITKAEIEAKLTGEISSHTHAGGGAGGMTSVRMMADVPNATTAMANATGLSFAAQALSDYIIDANILWDTSSTAVGIKISADFSSTGHTMAGQWIVNVANGTLDGAAFNADDVTVTTTAAPFTTSNHAKLWAILRTGANAGTFVVRFAAETAGIITIKAGSVLRYEKTL